MGWQFVDWAIVAAPAVVSLAMGGYAWRRRQQPGARELAAVMVAGAIWAFGYSLEVGLPAFSEKLFWAKVEYLGIVTVPVAWLLFALRYLGRDRWLTWWTGALLGVFPAATLALVATNTLHGWIWSAVRPPAAGTFGPLEVSYGPFFWVHTAYSYTLLLAGTGLLVRRLLRSISIYRWQAAVLLLGVATPWALNGLYLSGIQLVPGVDPTPYAFVVTGLVFAFGLSRCRLLDLAPVGRDASMEGMRDGVIVLDPRGRVVDLNSAAAAILGWNIETALGQEMRAALPPQLAALVERDDQWDTQPELAQVVGVRARWFEATVSELTGAGNRRQGQLIVLRDITERSLAEARLRQAEAKYRTLVEQIPAVHYVMGMGQGAALEYVSPQVEAVLGRKPEQLLGEPDAWVGLVHPDDRADVIGALARARETVEPVRLEYRMMRAGGDTVWVRDQAVPLRDETGRPRAWHGVLLDITERKRAEDAARFLAMASDLLASSLDYETTLQSVARLAVPSLADWCAVDVIDQDGEMRRVAIVNADPVKTEWALRHRDRYPFGPREDSEMARVMRTGEAEFIPELTDEVIVAAIPDPAASAALLALGVRSVITVPLIARGRTLGALMFVMAESNRRFNQASFELVQELARRAALAVDNASLYRAAQDREQRYRSLFDHNPNAVVSLDLTGRIVSANAETARRSGYAMATLIGAPFWRFVAERQRGAVSEHFQRVARGASQTFDVTIPHRDGRPIETHVTLLPTVVDGSIVGLYAIIQDVTERNALQRQLVHQALHDSMTELANRALFIDRLRHGLERASRTGRPLAIVLLDLDHFKVINDSLGHQAGDALLIEAAGRIRHHLRPGDTAARFGGDEYAVLLEDIAGEDEAVSAAEQLTAALHTPAPVAGHEIALSASMGIVVARADHETAEDLLRNGDVALYQAKRNGRSRWEIFDPSMNSNAIDRLRLESDLRRAIDHGELYLDFQPLVELATGRVAGLEALVRWRHPERGVISPAEFIPIAEEAGLIIPIGQFVLRDACRNLRRWQDRYPSASPLSVSVNLSARQLRDPGLAGDVARTIAETGIDARALTLEITESAVVEDGWAAVETLRALQGLGARVAIDDFGTGYSSLAYLKRLPIDIVKVDRSFLDGVDDGDADVVVLDGIVEMTHALELTVIAEGVESAKQYAKIRTLGCDLAQGFLFARPLSPVQVDALLSGGSTLTASSNGHGADLSATASLESFLGDRH